MRYERVHRFGDLTGLELGFSYVGRPFMTVHAWVLGRVAVDTGLTHQRAVAARFFAERGVRTALLTHYHEDHSGGAAALARAGVRVHGSERTAQRMARRFPIEPYRHLIWGQAHPVEVAPLPAAVEDGPLRLEPLATPGHCADHVVYLEPNRGWLFSGDLFIAERVRYFRTEERLDDEIDSLRRVLRRDFDAVWCAHHPRPRGGARALRNKLDFLENFRGEVRALAAGGRSVPAIMEALRMREKRTVQLMTMGDVSLANMIRAALDPGGPAAEHRPPGRP